MLPLWLSFAVLMASTSSLPPLVGGMAVVTSLLLTHWQVFVPCLSVEEPPWRRREMLSLRLTMLLPPSSSPDERRLVCQVVFKCRVRDNSMTNTANPFTWKDVKSEDLFKGKVMRSEPKHAELPAVVDTVESRGSLSSLSLEPSLPPAPAPTCPGTRSTTTRSRK